MSADTTLGPHDEPQNSSAVVAVHHGDYRRQEIWIRSSVNIGNWYPLGGEFGFRQGPDGVREHPHWEDVLVRGPVTLLTAGDGDAYRAGWANGRRRLVEQIETLSDKEDGRG